MSKSDSVFMRVRFEVGLSIGLKYALCLRDDFIEPCPSADIMKLK
jgi:hypothetical protein